MSEEPATAGWGPGDSAEALARDPEGVIEEISPRDHMFRVRERYLRSGRTGLDCIRLALLAGEKTTVASALDLPSGHGRVLRWIKAEFPAARLAACDIDHDGVDFCAATFGATPIYGQEDPGDIRIDDRYDLIWCGSLLTHLPPERWDGFLDLFEGALAPEGLLVLTTHGRRIAERIRDPETGRGYLKEPAQREQVLGAYEQDGLGYCDYTFSDEYRESLSLPRRYGISLVRPSVMCEMLARRPALRLVTLIEGRFNGQDVFGVTRA